jgi:hypothetical protein
LLPSVQNAKSVLELVDFPSTREIIHVSRDDRAVAASPWGTTLALGVGTIFR